MLLLPGALIDLTKAIEYLSCFFVIAWLELQAIGVHEFVHAVVAAFPEHLVVAFVVWLRRHDGS